MKCPVCNTELQIAVRAGIEIDYCPNCRGVWLDRGELDKIIERHLLEMQSFAHSEPSGSAPKPFQSRSAPRPQPHYEDDPYDDLPRKPKRYKKRNWLEELFDIFD